MFSRDKSKRRAAEAERSATGEPGVEERAISQQVHGRPDGRMLRVPYGSDRSAAVSKRDVSNARVTRMIRQLRRGKMSRFLGARGWRGSRHGGILIQPQHVDELGRLVAPRLGTLQR